MTGDDALRMAFTERAGELRTIQARLDAVLQQLDLSAIEIRSRVKTYDSVAAKLDRLGGGSLDDVPDLVAARVVVADRDALKHSMEVLSAELGTALPAAPSDAVHLTLSGSHLSPDLEARGTGVEIQVMTAEVLGRHLLPERYKPRLRSGTAGAAATHPLVARLRGIVDAFEQLLARDDVHEKRDIHSFIEQNPFLLFPNPDAVFSEAPLGLGTEHRIDFLVRRPNATYLLVELENPRHRITVRSGDFTAEVNHALCQVEDWQEWLETNLTTAQRYYPELTAPEGLVVIGRANAGDPNQERRIRRRNVNMRGRLTIVTYDDLLDGARAYVRSLERGLTPP